MANRYTLTERQKRMDTYLKGCVNLYGFVTIRQFLKVYNRYNQPKLLKEELMECAGKLVRISYTDYQIYSNAIVNVRVSDERMSEILRYQSGKTYYMPTEQEVLAYASPHFYERTPQIEALERFLKQEMMVNLLSANGFIEKLVWLIRIEEPMETQYKLMEEFGIAPKDMKQANELLQKIAEVHNHTRIWANCGYTPDQLFLERVKQ